MTRITLTAIAALLAAPVLAQTDSGQTDSARTNSVQTNPAPAFGDKGRDQTYLKTVEGTDIVNMDGETIGEVDEVLIDTDGLPAGYLVEIGGFLGIGEREVSIPLGVLEWDNGQYVSSMTRQQLETLAEYPD